MQLSRTVLCAAALLAAAACGGDNGTKPSGPVTFVPIAQLGSDTIGGSVRVDNNPTLRINHDSLVGLARGSHTLITRLNVEYLADSFTTTIDPSGSREVFPVQYAGSCRTYVLDANFCAGHSLVIAPQSRRLFCRVDDFGDFCSGVPDPFQVGLRWPVDNTVTQQNGYVTQAKLLIGARMSANVPFAANDTMAMSLYTEGDYGPRTRLRRLSADSLRWQTQVWTDLRRLPFYGQSAVLAADDRPLDNFGLEVRTTFQLSPAFPDVLFIRFDVTNISTDSVYQLVHPEVPAAGLTPRDIYLTPVIDANVGLTPPTTPLAEVEDDNATVFPVDSLVAAYDQNFSVAGFGSTSSARPGLVGLRLLSAPAAAKALIAEERDELDYVSVLTERNTYRLLAAGRAGAANSGCTDYTSAYVCAPESGNNVLIGWSIGPIAQLAPGQSTSLTVALVLAEPAAGSYTSGTNYPPQNNLLGSTSRPLYGIASTLRTLSGQIAGTTVAPTR